MSGTFTPNYKFSLQGQGDNVNLWGTVGVPSEPGLNNGVFQPLDSILGGRISIPIFNGNNSLSVADWDSAGIFVLVGAITAPANFILPLSDTPAVAGQAVGGKFVVVNNTSGNFSVTVKTAASGSTGVAIPQTPPPFSGAGVTWGVALYSDLNTGNVSYQDYGVEGFAKASNGTPNGTLAGVAAGPVTNASLAFDYVNSILYVCTTTGSPSTAVWTNIVSGALPIPSLQGRLTPVSNTPVLTSNFVPSGNTTIYYTPYTGNWAAYHNGTTIVPFKFSQLPVVLSASQSANSAYDIYLAYNGGTPVIGVNNTPWTSNTSRGGSIDIQRDSSSGLWVNSNTTSILYNNGTISGTISNVPVGQLIYLGSIYIDSSAGQVSCLMSYGGGNGSGSGNSVARKWGVWNAYNRVSIVMQLGDSSTSAGGAGTFNFTQKQGAAVWAQVNGTGATSIDGSPLANGKYPTVNLINTFCGLAEEPIESVYNQLYGPGSANACVAGIGINSTSSPAAFSGILVNTIMNATLEQTARSILTPSLGVNTFYPLVYNLGGTGNTITIYSQSNACYMTTKYMG